MKVQLGKGLLEVTVMINTNLGEVSQWVLNILARWYTPATKLRSECRIAMNKAVY